MIKLVVFDLDGTLMNAYPAVEESVNAVLHHFHLPPQGQEAIKRAVGWGPERLLEAFLKPHQIPEALAMYDGLHGQALLRGTTLLPGAMETISALQKRGCRLAVASNRPRRFSVIAVQHLGIEDFFDSLVCGDDLPQGKPHPEILYRVMQQCGCRPQDMIYVGDMTVDIETGRAAGVRTVAIATGSHTEEELRQAGPWRMIQRLEEIPDLVELGTAPFSRGIGIRE